MARIHLLTVHPESDPRARGAYVSLKRNAELDRYKVHELTNDPAIADIILFAEIDAGRLCGDVLRHPLVKRFRAKCFMFSTDWRVVPFLPGVYTATERKWYLPGRVRPGFYPDCLIDPLVKQEPWSGCDLLFSFMGDLNTHKVRRVLAGLRHPRGQIVDTSNESQAVMWRGSAEQREAFWQRFADMMKRSKFVLCPRGVSPSSIRLFETMMMGRVPVVISDEWMPPAGPAWETFILRVAEKDAAGIPRLLEENEGRAEEMAATARREWEAHFSPDRIFHRVVELCLEIERVRGAEWVSRMGIIPQLLQPHNLREWARVIKGRIRG